MSIYQINNIIFTLHSVLAFLYAIYLIAIFKKIDILKTPAKNTFLALKYIGIFALTSIFLLFELYYLYNFTESKRDNLYLIISIFSQVLYLFMVFINFRTK